MQRLKSKKYPDVPEYGVRLDLGYWIETNISISPRISTQWITVPETAQLSDNSYTTDVPSAFLDVQMPYTGSNNTGTTFACSVDARWAMGTYSGGPVGDIDADYVQTATIQNTRPFGDLNGFQYNFLPIDDGSWRRVEIDIDWLNTLTPPFDSNTSGWTSLAALLTDIGIDNITGSINQWDEVRPVLETIIAVFVADGMSRQGYAANGGSSTNLGRTEPTTVGQFSIEPAEPSSRYVRLSTSRKPIYPTAVDHCRRRLRLPRRQPRVLPRTDGAVPTRGTRARPHGIRASNSGLLRRMGLVCRPSSPSRQLERAGRFFRGRRCVQERICGHRAVSDHGNARAC